MVPTIEIHPPRDPEPLAAAIVVLRAGAYEWVAFTSANGVDRTWDALEAAGADARAFAATKVAAIGPATARAIERRGLRPDLVATEFRGEALADALLEAPGSGRARVLLARAAVARDVLPETLRAAGWQVDVVAAYETRPTSNDVVERLTRELAAGRIDAVTFTSSSTVDNLCDLLGPDAARRLAGAADREHWPGHDSHGGGPGPSRRRHGPGLHRAGPHRCARGKLRLRTLTR